MADRITELLTNRFSNQAKRPTQMFADVGTALLEATAGQRSFGDVMNERRASELKEFRSLYDVLSREEDRKLRKKGLELDELSLDLRRAEMLARLGNQDARQWKDAWSALTGDINNPSQKANVHRRAKELAAQNPDLSDSDAIAQAIADLGVTEQQKPPSGFRRTDSGLAPIPGGPADPDYMKQVSEAKREPDPQYSGEVYLDEQVGKFYQVNPETGKREYVSPNEEFLIEQTKDGLRIRKGPSSETGVTRSTTADMEKKLLNARENLVRLREIQSKFRPEFQQIPTRLGVAWTGLKSKLQMGDISKEDRQLLIDYADYRRDATSNMNLYIKEITGAQMSEPEANRLRKAIPDPGDGIFDGDDPITFEAKMNSAIKEAEKAMVRYKYYLQNGITDIDEISLRTPLDEIKVWVNPETGERGTIIEGQWVPMQ